MEKNTGAIDKIIAKLAMKDYLKANTDKTGRKYKTHHPYSLSMETNEARKIKIDYLNDVINEEQYKTWCLHYNLRS